MRAEILSYSRARGLFAGISLAGSTLRPDNGANKNLYGKEVSAKAIVFNQAVPIPASTKGVPTKNSVGRPTAKNAAFHTVTSRINPRQCNVR
jgi:lipid-binding SYLF domain-containing protein